MTESNNEHPAVVLIRRGSFKTPAINNLALKHTFTYSVSCHPIIDLYKKLRYVGSPTDTGTLAHISDIMLLIKDLGEQ